MGFRFRKRIRSAKGVYWNVAGKASRFRSAATALTKQLATKGTI
jgi:hypothetical protein